MTFHTLNESQMRTDFLYINFNSLDKLIDEQGIII